jgi:hypothetical protein
MRIVSVRIMSLAIIGCLVLIPINAKPVQAGLAGKLISKIVFTTAKTVIDKGKGKKMMPIVAGYKKGKNPLPKGTNATQTYKNIWQTLKNDIGIK